MTIEQEALELVNEVRRERSYPPIPASRTDRTNSSLEEALYRAIERSHKAEQELAAHKAEVSEALLAYFTPAHPSMTKGGKFARFIIPTPDPLYECVREALPSSMPDHHALAITKNLRAAAAKRGLERLDQ